jgi:PTS system mannose-specific IID component
MPAWLTGGMAVGGGMVCCVGYCMVINMMASKEVWPFFALGFVLAAIKELTLIALGVIGLSLAIIYLGLKDMASRAALVQLPAPATRWATFWTTTNSRRECETMAEATIEKNADGKIVLSKAVRKQVMWRHQYLQGSWNYERMQNGGWCFSMIPAIKALYKDPEDQKAALKRHLEFYNTHPYVSAPVIGVVLAMEEERANGAPIDDVAIQGVKVGMMGPLAGVGDPVFWYTVRPILGALGASLALSGSIVGPLLFFIAWNIIRIAFLWYTQEAGYNLGTSITKDLSGGLLGRLTEGASILGMFIIGALVERWVSINFKPVVATIQQQAGAYIDWSSHPAGADGIKQRAHACTASLGATALDPDQGHVTLQSEPRLSSSLASLPWA